MAALALCLVSLGQAEEQKKSIGTLELLRSVQVGPKTAALAERASFSLSGVAAATDDVPPRPGDQVTALVSLASFTGTIPGRMWVIRLQLQPASTTAPAKERSVTYYTNTGEKFTFRSTQTPLLLETLGPISAETDPAKPLPVRPAKISAATDYLALDLCRTADVLWRLRSNPQTAGLKLSSAQKRFPADEIKVQQPKVAELGFTSDDLRSFTDSLPALMQFLQIIQRTPDLKDILYQVIEKPSVFDVLASGGDSSLHFEFMGGGKSKGQELFWPEDLNHEFSVLMFSLNMYGKPILNVALHVAPPRPPLLLTAGIVGIAAWAPEKADKVIIVRVVSASSGPP